MKCKEFSRAKRAKIKKEEVFSVFFLAEFCSDFEGLHCTSQLGEKVGICRNREICTAGHVLLLKHSKLQCLSTLEQLESTLVPKTSLSVHKWVFSILMDPYGTLEKPNENSSKIELFSKVE